MSFGSVDRFKSKKAFADAVRERGAESVLVEDTSAFDNRGRIPVSQLRDGIDGIVGPDPYTDRRWFAYVKTNKAGERVVR